MAETICLLGKNRSTGGSLPERKPGCTHCARCGWNPKEGERRRKLISKDENWMTGPDKLRRLMVGRNDDES